MLLYVVLRFTNISSSTFRIREKEIIRSFIHINPFERRFDSSIDLSR